MELLSTGMGSDKTGPWTWTGSTVGTETYLRVSIAHNQSDHREGVTQCPIAVSINRNHSFFHLIGCCRRMITSSTSSKLLSMGHLGMQSIVERETVANPEGRYHR